jgi:type IV pilus assembly protein PilV
VTVVSIQKATLIANTNARNLAAATEVAQAWVERMRVDALAWNYPLPPNAPDIGSDTVWLKNVTTSGWFVPAVSVTGNPLPAGAPTADVMGADIYNSATDPAAPAFCVQARLTQFGQNPNLWALARLVRVEVRVFWDKRNAPMNCAAQVANALPSYFGSVYLVSGVLANNAPY